MRRDIKIRLGLGSKNRNIISNITFKVIKPSDDTQVDIKHKLWNGICKTGVIPSIVNKSIFILSPKKAKAAMCAQYRTYIKVYVSSTKRYLDSHTPKNIQKIENKMRSLQSDFISEKGTNKRIFKMIMIFERYCNVNKTLSAGLPYKAFKVHDLYPCSVNIDLTTYGE